MRESTATKCCRIAWCFMFGRRRGKQLRVWFFHAIRDESVGDASSLYDYYNPEAAATVAPVKFVVQ